MGLKIRSCDLASELLLQRKGVKCFMVLLHLLVLLVGIFSILLGVASFLLPTFSSSFPHTNCTLTTSVRNHFHFPLKLLPVLTGMVLILIDVSILCLVLFIKCCGCGRLVVVWHLSLSTCTATWTVWCALYLNSLAPNWLADRKTCDLLVVGVAVGGASLVGVVTVVYLAVSLVVICYECRRKKRKVDSGVASVS